MYFIYILYSASSNIYYIGFSEDVERRFRQHNSALNTSFTSKHSPWILKAVFSCGQDRAFAMKVEKFIKNQKSRSFIERLIADAPLTGILSQMVRVQ
jgi:putative endonuclease